MRFALALMLIATLNCAMKSRPVLLADEIRNPSGVMHLIGRYAVGQACPVDGLVFSAGHLVQPLYVKLDCQVMPISYRWSDASGRSGYVESRYLFESSDLGLLEVMSGTPRYYRHAEREPAIGDKVHWLQFRFDNPDVAFETVIIDGHVKRTLAGHISIFPQPIRTTSGQCLFNSSGEVLGVIVWGWGLESPEDIGMVVSLAGRWWPGLDREAWK